VNHGVQEGGKDGTPEGGHNIDLITLFCCLEGKERKSPK